LAIEAAIHSVINFDYLFLDYRHFIASFIEMNQRGWNYFTNSD